MFTREMRVPENKVNCVKCDSLLLESTACTSGGLCMPCFMELNDGLRPAELKSLRGRGLLEFFNRWNSFVKKGVPKVKRNRKNLDKLNHYLPVINASVSGYLRFGKGCFNGEQNLKFLAELKEESEGELLVFLTETESLNGELINATKT